MSKFKVGDEVRCVQDGISYVTKGRIYEVVSAWNGWYRVVTDDGVTDGYREHVFELVESNPILTPEEVFEHLRKGTKLQWSCKHFDKWCEPVGGLDQIQVNELIDYTWRIKPEPEIIELNGKKYREIVE